MDVVYPYSGVLLSNKKEQLLTPATIRINLNRSMLSEGSQIQKTTD